MKSDVFHFKSFDVRQRCSAMKVGMDGVSLGAWAFECIDDDSKFTVWDVGTGTGLLSLMIAQRFPSCEVYAVEIDGDAAKEAEGNFVGSQFSDRLHCVNGNIFELAETLPSPDAIVCNPPYFRDSLASPDQIRSTARHQDSLGSDSAMALAGKYLSAGGKLALILPYEAGDRLDFLAAVNSLSLERRVDLVSVEGKAPKRTLWEFVKGCQGKNLCGALTVKNSAGTYTDEYYNLTNNFYLDK